MKVYAESRFNGKGQFSELNKEHVTATVMKIFRDTNFVISTPKDQATWNEEADGNPDRVRLRVETVRQDAFILFDEDETREIFNALREAFVARKKRKEAAARKPPSSK
jgi:hypothetical protein